MQHTIKVDSKTKTGKSLLSIARELSRNDKNIVIKAKPLLLTELEQSVHNLNLVKQGKLKAKPLSDLLDEL